MKDYLGNKELLNNWKIGFTASRNIPTVAIMDTLDWATKTSKRADVSVVSGFHSRLEKDVLKFLLRGECGIIVVLARGMYSRLPKLYENAMNENRLLIITLEKKTVTRVSERTAHRRNKYVERIADEFRRIEAM